MNNLKHTVQANIFEVRYDDVTILPHNQWSAYVNFRIVGLDKKVHQENIYTMLCSQEYARQPSDEPVDDKTLVMNHLDKEYTKEYIEEVLLRINGLLLPDWKQYYEHLREYFHIDES